MMKFSIITLGCKVNQYESEAMLEQLLSAGFLKADTLGEADVVLINSCTVTGKSDQKLRQIMHRVKRERPCSILVLTGCMPQAFPEIASKFKEADIILGNSNRNKVLCSIIDYISRGQRIIKIDSHDEDSKFESMEISGFSEKTRAFIKIEDGCNRFCSYCIIPYARGRVRSKSIIEIKKEIEILAKNGHKEVVLVGINLSAYGSDLGNTLIDAVEAACSIEGIERVRLSSLEPERMNGDLIRKLSEQIKFCPHFHFSLQSGCDKTLKAMNRHYNTSEYMQIVNNIRENFENPAITTDIMVGFPGETDSDFEESLKFVKKVGFSKVHVFEYSKRPGTRAADMPNQVSPNNKSIRSKKMAQAALESRKDFLKSQIGKIESVLFERKLSKNIYKGYTRNYTVIKIESEQNISSEIIDVAITGTGDEYCIGNLIV